MPALHVPLTCALVKGYARGLSRTWNVPEEFRILWWRSREHRQLIIDVCAGPFDP
jgi:hypothetical protein